MELVGRSENNSVSGGREWGWESSLHIRVGQVSLLVGSLEGGRN